jgi:hypothetical protein
MDAVELLLRGLLVIPHWRTMLCMLTGVIVAGLFLVFLPFVAMMQAVWIAALCFVPGAMWEARAKPTLFQPNRQTSKGVAYATAVILAAVWGASSSASFGNMAFGFVFLLIVAMIWLSFAQRHGEWFPGSVAVRSFQLLMVFYIGTSLGLHYAL